MSYSASDYEALVMVRCYCYMHTMQTAQSKQMLKVNVGVAGDLLLRTPVDTALHLYSKAAVLNYKLRIDSLSTVQQCWHSVFVCTMYCLLHYGLQRMCCVWCCCV
jgi:hypothetical protein